VPLQELDWNDLFGLQGQLTEEERLIQRAARDRAQGRLAPRVRDAFRHEKTDPAIFREMGELGPQVAWVGGSGDLALSSQPVAGFSGAPALDGDGHFAGLVLLKPAAVAASRDPVPAAQAVLVQADLVGGLHQGERHQRDRRIIG
jgi:hypothetical protein